MGNLRMSDMTDEWPAEFIADLAAALTPLGDTDE